MILLRLVVALAQRHQAAPHFAPGDLLEVKGGDAVMVLASMPQGFTFDVGLWWCVDQDHPAALLARDLSTLSHLRRLSRIVVESDNARLQAEVVSALLSDREVNFSNGAATLRRAYNRPAPAHPIEVGYCERDEVRLAKETLRVHSREPRPWGEIVTYA